MRVLFLIALCSVSLAEDGDNKTCGDADGEGGNPGSQYECNTVAEVSYDEKVDSGGIVCPAEGCTHEACCEEEGGPDSPESSEDGNDRSGCSEISDACITCNNFAQCGQKANQTWMAKSDDNTDFAAQATCETIKTEIAAEASCADWIAGKTIVCADDEIGTYPTGYGTDGDDCDIDAAFDECIDFFVCATDCEDVLGDGSKANNDMCWGCFAWGTCYKALQSVGEGWNPEEDCVDDLEAIKAVESCEPFVEFMKCDVDGADDFGAEGFEVTEGKHLGCDLKSTEWTDCEPLLHVLGLAEKACPEEYAKGAEEYGWSKASGDADEESSASSVTALAGALAVIFLL